MGALRLATQLKIQNSKFNPWTETPGLRLVPVDRWEVGCWFESMIELLSNEELSAD